MSSIFSKTSLLALACGATICFTSCSDSDNNGGDDTEKSPHNSALTVPQYDLLDHYVNDIVISTYNDMAAHSVQFLDCVNALASCVGTTSEKQEKLDAACAAWRETRAAWEISEAFLFGTASESKIDPHMDSWPLDNNQLSNLLKSNTFSSVNNPEDRATLLRDNYNNNLMGFHAAEYIIFADGASKKLNTTPITAEEMAYLQATALVLAEDCIRLKTGWAGTEGLTSREQEIYERIEDDWGISANYGYYMLQTGQMGSIYVSFNNSVNQILEGCSTISNEVGTEKMENPIAKNSVLEVESWYSWNSIDDFQNNIRGIEYVYTGKYKGTAGRSIQQLLQAENEALDKRIMDNIEITIEALENIRTEYGSYRQLIAVKGSQAKNDANVIKAQTALKDLTKALGEVSNYLD